jgi:hypothetical protein
VRRSDDLNASDHYLGTGLVTDWDNEYDGQPSLTATGDGNDELGVRWVASERWLPNTTVHLLADVMGNNAYLAAWFDWNNDGDFNDSGEYRYYDFLTAGTHTLDLTLPGNCCANGSSNTTLNARFRLYQGFSPPAIISPTGMVLDGEVEDYQWNFEPTAVVLSYSVAHSAQSPRLLAAASLLATGIGLAVFARPRRRKSADF